MFVLCYKLLLSVTQGVELSGGDRHIEAPVLRMLTHWVMLQSDK